jgi:hypothetical protein
MKKPRLSEEKPGFLDLGDKSPDLDVVELGGFEPPSASLHRAVLHV